MIRTTVLLGCFFALGAQVLYSFPFHLPAFPPSKEAPIRDANTLPPPFEGKYFLITDQTGTATVEISGNATLPDTTIVTDVSDIEGSSGNGNYTHFSDGMNRTYDSNGTQVDSATYVWNEADSSVSVSNEDTTMTFYYQGTDEGMTLSLPDTSWTTTEDDGLGGTYTATYSLENVSFVFTETSDPTNPVLYPGGAVGNKIKVQSSREGVRFTWERPAGVARLRVTDVGGRMVVEEKIRPGQKETNINLPASGIFTYRVVGNSGVLTQGRVYHRTQ